MTFDLIITTCNRPDKLLQLIEESLQCTLMPENIIVVDSSDDSHAFKIRNNIQQFEKIIYIRSSHKNQPYQRLLGSMVSKAAILVFFDDDLHIIDQNIFNLLVDAYKEPKVVGATVRIDYRSSIVENLDPPVFSSNSRIYGLLSWVTFSRLPHAGKASRLGLVGSQPRKTQKIDFFYGPCMSFRQEIITEIITNDLLSMYESEYGKGEDKAISFLANKFGVLKYINNTCLVHPPNNSSYFFSTRNFFARVTYSRLYLSMIYAESFQLPKWKEYIIFYWFAYCRIVIALVSFLIKPTNSRKNKLIGIVYGTLLTIHKPPKEKYWTPGIDWKNEIKYDLSDLQ